MGGPLMGGGGETRLPPQYGAEPWYGEEITLYDAWGNPIPEGGGWTINDWYGEVLRTKGELVSRYGLGNIDLIYQLMALGMWDDDDWARWREDYDESYG